MRRPFCSALWIILLGSAPGVRAAPPGSDEFDRRVDTELATRHPELVPLWQQANAARDREDYTEAVRLYAEIRARAPEFTHATRRQAGAELRLGQRRSAIGLARQALAAETSAVNLSMLAWALAETTPESAPTVAERQEALNAAGHAALLDRNDFYVHATLCQVGLNVRDLASLQHGVARLEIIAPREVATHQFKALSEASAGRFAEAEASLLRAKELGLSEGVYASMLTAIRQARPLGVRALPWLWRTGAIWLGGLAVLFGVGLLLSRAALRAAESLPAAGGHVTGASVGVRRAYTGVLWLSCAYYYASIPLMIVLILATGGGLIYAFFAVGQIPIKLVAIIAIVTLVTLWAILKGLLVRGSDEDPGLPLDTSRQPRLSALLDTVAARIGTRPVERVFLTPGTDVAVMERGGLVRQLRGAGERCLILGVGVLEGFRIGALKAVLAHEYGHFSNRDTAGGGLALSVRLSLLTMAAHLAQGGAATWYNPVWLFLNGFHRVFLRISQGASRLQEVMADRWAAAAYGAQAFEEGLRHVIARSIRFDAYAQASLQQVVAQQQSLANLYHHVPAERPAEDSLEKDVEAALSCEPSAYDSHPAPAQRFRWVRALRAAAAAPEAEDAAEAWGLFEDREEIERRMTGEVRDNLFRAHGVRIASEADAAPPH